MRPTFIIRQIAHQHGYHDLYTNKYEHSRTVKAYGSLRRDDEAYFAAVREAMLAAGYVEGKDGFSMKKVKGRGWGMFMSQSTALIVRISEKIQPIEKAS